MILLYRKIVSCYYLLHNLLFKIPKKVLIVKMKKKKPLTRSQNMARIKSKNTKPEIHIRKLLYKMGYRYRVNYSELPGTPDIFILKYNTAIFVNGCFWHRHENCKIATFPKTHAEYWEKKFRRNVERDIEVREKLFEMDISVITIWECEINRMRKNEEYKEKYLRVLRDRIERVFNYEEEDISVQMEIAEESMQ